MRDIFRRYGERLALCVDDHERFGLGVRDHRLDNWRGGLWYRDFDGRGHRRLRAPPANLNPDVVAAPRGHHRESIVAVLWNPVFDRAEFLQLRLRFAGQQLRQHAGHRVEIEAVRRDVDRLRADHHVGPLADVHHQRVAVGANDCGQ